MSATSTSSNSLPVVGSSDAPLETCAGGEGGVKNRQFSDVGADTADLTDVGVVLKQNRSYSDECSDGTSYSYLGRNVVNAVKPASKSMDSVDVFVQAQASESRIGSTVSLLGEQQRVQTSGLLIGARKEFGDWGYTVLLPMSHSENNDRYSALDNTRIGLSFEPTYHLMKRQVHGFDLDLGAKLAYQYTNFSDVAAVRAADGAYGISDFGNLGTTSLALNARLGMPLGANTIVQTGITVSELYNDKAQSVFGRNGSEQQFILDIVHNYSDRVRLFAGVQAQRFRLSSSAETETLGLSTATLGIAYRYNHQTFLNFNLMQTVASHFSSTAGLISANWQLR